MVQIPPFPVKGKAVEIGLFNLKLAQSSEWQTINTADAFSESRSSDIATPEGNLLPEGIRILAEQISKQLTVPTPEQIEEQKAAMDDGTKWI